MTRDTSTAGLIVRTALAEVVAMHVLKARADLRATVMSDLKTAIDDMTAALKARNDPKTQPILAALPGMLTELIQEIQAL